MLLRTKSHAGVIGSQERFAADLPADSTTVRGPYGRRHSGTFLQLPESRDPDDRSLMRNGEPMGAESG